MRKTNLFGATFLALTAGAWSMTAAAQTAAPAPAAPMAAPAAPMAAPAAPTEAPSATPAPDAGSPPAADSSAPMPKKHMMTHHKMMHGHGKLAATPAGNKAVEDLNAASLDAAKSGKPFVAPTTPVAAKMTAHTGVHHHHMMKPKGDATAPTAPADTSK